ncbi:hypothetical protein CHS0354_000471 [Potamilus streckersoni]|uniref:ATP-dependent helicase PriA n=1 Tax=Potamilus streckersoni TaxID=2493646 RepID=A0AAE0T6S3_9BIVA|nr:hypothetical protein CHS0354_000471 [Potamilus streckersoni]
MTASVFLVGKPSDFALTCRIPDALASSVFIGSTVLVNTGTKHIIGYVVDIHSATPTSSYIITECYDLEITGFSPVLIKFLLWMADYYISYPVTILQAALPRKAKIAPKEIVKLNPFVLRNADEASPTKSKLRQTIIHELTKHKSLSISYLERITKSSSVRESLRDLEKIGWISIERHISTPTQRPDYLYTVLIPKHNLLDTVKKIKSKKQKELLEEIINRDKYIFRASEVPFQKSVLGELVKKKILHCEASHVTSIQSHLSISIDVPYLSLSQDQLSAVSIIFDTMEKGQFHTFLLHGVTGSGKTNVYIELVKKAIQRDNERFANWLAIKSGSAKIALGARSTLFAPLPNLGIIIVDEEHDQSYKQDSQFIYHARDCAIMRAKMENAVCVLGSATPSFESYYQAKNKKYTLISLPKRIHQPEAPQIKIISLAEDELISPLFSKTLYNQISKRLELNEQVILLQNRRGYARYIQCERCGAIPFCTNCSVALTLHVQSNLLKCHYCKYSQPWKQYCHICSNEKLKFGTAGTEQFDLLLQRLFPNVSVVRMDGDSTSRRGAHAYLLNLFKEKKAAILLGTQMIAKGLDFPDVTLVAAIQADLGLAFPDFRATERIFDLLFQMAGRTGRSSKKGEVFLQTYNLRHPVFYFLTKQDYEAFFEYEMAFRKKLNFPPYSRLLKIEFSSMNENNCIIAVNEAHHFLTTFLKNNPDFEISECNAAVIVLLKNQFRYNIYIKQLNNKTFTKSMWRLMEKTLRPTWQKLKVAASIDIDTQSI